MALVGLKTIAVLIVVALINVFFGYWRSNTARFSKEWMLAIHIPVPIAIILRLSFLGWNWLLLPAFVGAFAIGQFAGGQVRRLLQKQRRKLTSFLLLDLFRVPADVRKES